MSTKTLPVIVYVGIGVGVGVGTAGTIKKFTGVEGGIGGVVMLLLEHDDILYPAGIESVAVYTPAQRFAKE